MRWKMLNNETALEVGVSAGQDAALRGIVLAGVHAWGDCVLEQTICRPMLPVADRPLLTHALDWMCSGGIAAATICGNSDTSRIRARLGDGRDWGIALDYSEDVMPRGPAGCVRDAAMETDAQEVVVVDGTIVPRVDLEGLLAAHHRAHAAVTIVVGRASECGDTDLEPVGIYVLDRSVVEQIPPTGYQDIKESLIPMLYRRGIPVAMHVVPGILAPRVTDAASYLSVNMWTVERMLREGRAPEGAVQIGEALIHPSAQVHSSARFVGPVLVGANCRIGADALVVGPTSFGNGVVVEAGAVVTRSVLWNHATVEAGAIIDQCVLTEHARVERGLVVRETVSVPARRAAPKVLERLAAWLSPASGPQVHTVVQAQP